MVGGRWGSGLADGSVWDILRGRYLPAGDSPHLPLAWPPSWYTNSLVGEGLKTNLDVDMGFSILHSWGPVQPPVNNQLLSSLCLTWGQLGDGQFEDDEEG